MDTPSLNVLIVTGAALGFFHTVTGPDHYIPFIAMARIGRWSLVRTIAITLACGVGHVGSSVVLGLLGIALGLAVGGLEWFEGVRGDVAGWLLLGFGLAYMSWGIRQAVRNRPHRHWHAHAGGPEHLHEHVHVHVDEHAHPHVHANDEARRRAQMTPWVLFTIFVLGPCEPLIPLLMYPAAQHSWWGVGLVTLVFGGVTLVTMLAVVLGAHLGLARVSFTPLERYSHALAGFALFACGLAIHFGL